MIEAPDGDRRVRLLTIDENHDGQRVDNFLLARLKGVPRSWVYRVLRRGEVRVNKGRCKPERRLRIGDVVRVPPLRLARDAAAEGPQRPPLSSIKKIENSIVFEDDLMLVVNKPSGLAVHGGSGVSFGLIESLRAARPQARFLELAHRLDRETSGCLMVAKRRASLRTLQELQRAGRIEKRYLALLAGAPRRDVWRVDQPLRKNVLASGERIVRVDPEGKAAATRFRVLRRFAGATLVAAELETGRTHQIRVHAQAAGHPILGDEKYGDDELNRRWRERGLRRLFLHAASLRLQWPETGAVFHCEAPLPAELEMLLNGLESDVPLQPGRL